MIPDALILAGAVLTLLAAVGVVRFRDALERAHALTKASTVGLLLVLVGAATRGTIEVGVADLVLVGVLQVLTLPVAATMMSRAAYRAQGMRDRPDTVDELAQANAVDESGPVGPDT
jgi:multicomponent Na+:H+ antiporter subunit G